MFIIKMIFLWWLVLWYWWRINAFARKYRKDPSFYHPQQRNDWLLKKARFFLWLYGVKLVVEGYDNIPKGAVILAPNHKSNIDPVLVLCALRKQTKEENVRNKIPTFLAKIELSKKRTIRNLLSLIDTIYVDRDNPRDGIKKINEFGAFVKKNSTCGVIFPEGTRVVEDELGDFKAGAFKVAVSNYLPIVPVAISDSRDGLNVKRMKSIKIKVTFLPALKPASFITMEPVVIAENVKGMIKGALRNE
ncbi:lysophospholipid acyltransferase family protein [Mycoplasmopsis agalactiae]|uniref:1 acyl SN glycerol 3 phosphate acyltransferase n=1 Tax=Mycoplasmopsis agalactiae TaxID=2110 RepID=D3VRT7_MYCAA|nr:lysophospholipid acyltransferase family protein [Mycoplasmopsis agalactiae]KAB6718681.1 1-acyl-sn-glycerol-3-phosphate acyltransferase [Mycoplasmopsis agalactiae]MCE6056754.1 1-acyl-sn-glycerol-3-phosphate acyltransferase [Mycoplasmopsis agalactiae]MCE6091129.1 1-acyl-sn-glycerol-3-phosphate acyltransferase [Mycoplasmopsis agalactiae]CBH41035.1 1 acyl SN glycerol 3 phosphate acyltransferase [Mycoplasmopsis agalactiae]